MGDRHKRDEWLQDLAVRQRSIVFPDTVQNEGRFWRNLGKQGWTPSIKIGLLVLGGYVFGTLTWVLIAILKGGVTWRRALAMLVFLALWGLLFAAIAWATNRSLRNIQNARRGPRR